MRENCSYKAALYMRLSKDDEGAAESASIVAQRSMLRNYAAENGYQVAGEYADDGFSGTTFDRPDFQRMIADIEAKKINLVITKDLSRLGRDYIQAGQYTEIFFPSKGVRYIAVNDGYDSASPYADIAPFKNVINEMYARDTSKKIRSAFAARMRAGAYVAAFAPYGYQKDPADKHRLVVDARSGAVVREIFRMAAAGSPPRAIAGALNDRGVPSPAVYRCMTRPGLDISQYSVRREWTSATIAKMLRNAVYLGHTAQGKTTKVSFKSPLSVANPRDAWILVENTHQALVDAETFDLAGRRMTARTCEKKGQFFNFFSGIAKCADCGRNLSATGTRKRGSPAKLVCGGYKLYGAGACGNHAIDYLALDELIRVSLRERMALSPEEHQALVDDAWKRCRAAAKRPEKGREFSDLERRMRELDGIIEKLYEDNAAGRLSDARMHRLLAKYEEQSKALEASLAASPPCAAEAACPSRETLDGRLRQMTAGGELTAALLFKCIDHIEVRQGTYERGDGGRYKRQSICIFYRFAAEPWLREYSL